MLLFFAIYMDKREEINKYLGALIIQIKIIKLY